MPPSTVFFSSDASRAKFLVLGSYCVKSVFEINLAWEPLQRNAPIESLTLPNLVRWDFPNDEDQGFIDADSFAQVVELVRHNASIHKLQLHIGECRGPRYASHSLF